MKTLLVKPGARAFLGRCRQCDAGGHSMSNTGPESLVLPAAAGGGGAWLCQAKADAGEGRA